MMLKISFNDFVLHQLAIDTRWELICLCPETQYEGCSVEGKLSLIFGVWWTEELGTNKLPYFYEDTGQVMSPLPLLSSSANVKQAVQ